MAAISKRLRYEVLRRDGHACYYCGAKAPEVKLVVDAVVPEALGGSHKDPANLRTACEPCNSGKTSTAPDAPLVAAVAEDAARWAQAMAAAAQEMLSSDGALSAAHQRFDAAWSGWTYGDDKLPVPKDPGWKNSVDALLAAGLPMRLLEECVQIAMSRKRVSPENTFRYMCGVAWNKVSKLQERAREIASGATPSPVPEEEDRYEQGRADAAREVLAELRKTEQEQYLEWADDGGYGESIGEPQTETERLMGAATDALSDKCCDLAELQYKLVETLDALPGDAGKRAMKAARQMLYVERGEGFQGRIFLLDSLRHLEDELKLPEEATSLFALPEAESTQWLTYAAALYPSGRLRRRLGSPRGRVRPGDWRGTLLYRDVPGRRRAHSCLPRGRQVPGQAC